MAHVIKSILTISVVLCLISTSLLILWPENVSAEDIELVPTSDVSIGFDVTYPSDGVHYTKVDDGASHDSATTYNRAVTNGDKDIFGLEDMSEPSGSYDIDVTIYVVTQDAGTGGAELTCGVVISSTEYIGVNGITPPNAWESYNYFWEENPAGGEWTYTVINAMNLYVVVPDAAPDVDVTSLYVIVTITYAAQWAPTFTSSPDTTADEDQAYSYTATCNETVTWSAGMTSNATWLTWTQANHTVWGTPDRIGCRFLLCQHHRHERCRDIRGVSELHRDSKRRTDGMGPHLYLKPRSHSDRGHTLFVRSDL